MMNKDMINVTELTMTSLEVAKVTGKRHANILRDIDNILKILNIDSTQIWVEYKDASGKGNKMAVLDKELTLTLTSGYSVKQRNLIIRRWLDLEEKRKQVNLPTTYLEALKELVNSQEEIQKLNTLLDNEFGFSSILRAATYAGVHEKEFNWRPLKAMTLKLGLEVKKVPSPRYGYQNLYPIRAFEAVYPDIDFDDLKPEYVDERSKLTLEVK